MEVPVAGSGIDDNSLSGNEILNQNECNGLLFMPPRKKLSFLQQLRQRELQSLGPMTFVRQNQITRELIKRLGVIKELEGHGSCVNCIEFNKEGNLLLSGSDDYSIILWDVLRKKHLKTISTGHLGNIFSVKFLPQSQDSIVISGAGDSCIEVREIQTGDLMHTCTCHCERVKRIATAPTLPHSFFSASEDGTVMLYDMRTKHRCNAQFNNLLINLRYHAGRTVECKCIAINPTRPELIAVGASDLYVRIYDRRMIKLTHLEYPPGGASRTQWERSNYTTNQIDPSNSNLPPGCVQYFTPGHLPDKMIEYNRQYRSLATTFLTYSSDGVHLLANIGGEHIYLFNTVMAQVPRKYVLPAGSANKVESFIKESDGPSNGICKSIVSTNGLSGHFSLQTNGFIKKKSPLLTPHAESLKARANQAFAKEDYICALQLYNEALQINPSSAVLYSNRAATLLKRKWEGDVYAALKDCFTALDVEPVHIKAHFRMAMCLHLLSRENEAKLCLEEFKKKHVDHSLSPTFSSLTQDITKALFEKQSIGDGVSNSLGDDDSTTVFGAQEQEWRMNAKDYRSVYCGHCNTTTDIKEAAFLGQEGQFIAAGSDDGNLFIWDRETTNLIKVIAGDNSIVNCVQSHPNTCLIATSGIESVVKLWGPLPQVDNAHESDIEVFDEVIKANQQRMSAGTLEMMLMHVENIAHVFGASSRSGGSGGSGLGGPENYRRDPPQSGGGAGQNVADVQCRTS